ncbi:MAG: type II secretion system protein [Planctomycetota bacterium]|nr:type II secretion system protein [Planctomycetota bacterium]
MMSRTSETSSSIDSASAPGGNSGFTLIEILIVMSIIGILAGLVLIAMGSIQKTAKDRATEALVERLTLQIADYYRKRGALPEDGYDTEVKFRGKSLKGSAALYHQLTSDIFERTFIAGERREDRRDPVAKFENSDLVIDDEAIKWIIDGHGTPIHYDNLTGRLDPPENDMAADPDSKYARWRFTVGFDSHYEIWSIGMREAAEEDELRVIEDSTEEEAYDEF